MKKTVCMLLALLLAVLVPVSALAEASGGTQSDEAVISGAIDALKEYWKQISDTERAMGRSLTKL